jgi:hypothetical protein
MLSKSIQKSLYKEVCSDVVGRLSVGLGVSKESLMGLLLEEREEVLDGVDGGGCSKVLDGCSKVLDGGGGSKVLGSSVLPWCGFVIEECCRGLKLNNGLHTQCNRSRGEKDYCMSCVKLMEKNGGSLPYGSVDDRLNVIYWIILIQKEKQQYHSLM